jgi:hypothetical protein
MTRVYSIRGVMTHLISELAASMGYAVRPNGRQLAALRVSPSLRDTGLLITWGVTSWPSRP